MSISIYNDIYGGQIRGNPTDYTGTLEDAATGLTAAFAGQRYQMLNSLPEEYAQALEARKNEIRTEQDVRRIIREMEMKK